MQWISLSTQGYKKQMKKCWHFWFAWHPVIVKIYPDGAVKRAWLCKVKRKGELRPYGTMHGGYCIEWIYEYKAL